METGSNRKVGFALLIIVLGVLLLVDNLQIWPISIPHIFVRWHSILILIGLFLILVRDKLGPGITLIVVGGFFMMSDLLHISVFSLWPALLILVGILILVRRRDHQHYTATGTADSSDIVDEISIFSGTNKVVNSKNFKGGKVTTIFGGAELDLSQAQLAEGNNVIDLVTIFGGSEIFVPPDWEVQVRVNPIFGGYSDERNTISTTDPSRKLIISGVVLFGGGELKIRNR